MNLLTDITDLLLVPQKVAAVRLGITESMLSKKYKEATNRKWPYRFLKKLDRDIEDANTEQEKQILKNKKKEILAPVSIYVKRIPTEKDSNVVLEIDKK